MQENEQSVAQLQEELSALRIEHKKQGRALDLALKQIERNKIAAATRENVNKAITAKRSELERYMNLLLGNCPDAILLFDNNGCIVYATDSFLKLCNIPSYGIINGKNPYELLHPYTTQTFQAQLSNALDHLEERKETIVFAEDVDFAQNGSVCNYNIQVTPMLNDNSEIKGSIILFTDVTELNMAKAEAERANAAKSDFLAMVSHEIRTPMNAIIGVASMLRDTSLNETQLDYLSTLQNSSHILLNLINDILDFSKIEAGKLDLVEGYFRLSDIMEHLLSMFQPMFYQKRLEFVCESANDLPEVVYGDDQRIKQILTNILNNSLKYTKEGSVHLSLNCGEDGTICFAIRDTGIGIRKEAISKIFEAFEQLDKVKNKGIVGTGLGLAITKRLCGLMKGTIQVESEYGKGSVFTIRLPLKVGTKEQLPSKNVGKALPFIAPGAKILIVDDIEINLQITEYMLSLYQIETELALNGLEAVKLAEKNDYDLILMDQMMPVMDGIEATKTIRAMKGNISKVPIIALTANAISGVAEMFLASGFNAFLSKPMDTNALADCLFHWLPKDKIEFE